MPDIEKGKAKVYYWSSLVHVFVIGSLCNVVIYLAFYSIVDFFKELPQFLVKGGPILTNIYGTDWESRLEVLTMLIFMLSILHVFCSILFTCPFLFITYNIFPLDFSFHISLQGKGVAC